MDPLAIVVVGLGAMGRRHVAAARAEGLTVVAAVDPNRDDADLPIASSLEALDELGLRYDAAIVASPSATHEQVALSLLARGKHVLVEKPLARSVHACVEVGRAARAAGRVLAVGHVERFNPAFVAVQALLSSTGGSAIGAPVRLDLVRVGARAGRPREDVLTDVAVHDLDLASQLLGRISLRAARTESFRGDAIVDAAELWLAAGAVRVRVHADVTKKERARRLVLEGTQGVVEADLLHHRALLRTRAGERELAIAPVDALRAQVAAFRRSIGGVADARIAGAECAARAIDLAEQARARANQPVRLAEPMRELDDAP